MPTPVFAPDGTVRNIPDDQLQAALNAGGKVAVKMTDPSGTLRWIPQDKQQDALRAGGKLMDNATPKAGWSLGSVLSGTDPAHQAIDRAAQTEPVDTSSVGGFARSVANNLGAGAVRVFSPLVHPLDTAAGFGKTVAAAYGNPGAQADLGEAMVRPFVQNPSGEAVAAIPQAALALAGMGEGGSALERRAIRENLARAIGGNAANAIDGSGPSGGAVGNAVTAVKQSVYPTPQSVAASELAARNLGKAAVVSPQAMPNFVKAAVDEAPTVKAYAQANNIPIDSTLDAAKAAQGAADAVQAHYDQNILGPHTDTAVSVPSYYRGTKLNVEGSRATLGDIQNRINAINQELNPNFRKGLSSQTSAANVSDADLIAEKRGLNNLLRDKLSNLTGLTPDDIAAVQQKAGKLRTIADELNLSANTNTTAAGKAAMGRSDIPTGTKLGMLERGVQALRGGPEIIGNRAIRNAFNNIETGSLDLPQPTKSGAGSLQQGVVQQPAEGAAYKLWKWVNR